MAEKKAEHEAHVRGPGPAGVDSGVDEHGLTVLSVSESDMPAAEPMHKFAEASDAFDPNAALRNKAGVGPGLQDSEALRPAAWVDSESDAARAAAADAEVAAAQRLLDRAKARAKAVKAGEPLDQELGQVRG